MVVPAALGGDSGGGWVCGTGGWGCRGPTSADGKSAYVNLAGTPCNLTSDFQFNLEPSWLQPNPGPETVTLTGSTSKDPGAVPSSYTTGMPRGPAASAIAAPGGGGALPALLIARSACPCMVEASGWR